MCQIRHLMLHLLHIMLHLLHMCNIHNLTRHKNWHWQILLLKRKEKKANADTRVEAGGKNGIQKKADKENGWKKDKTHWANHHPRKVVHETTVGRKENTQQKCNIRTNYFANLYLGISSIFIVMPSAFFPECTKDANAGLVNWFLGVWACTVRAIILYNLNPA